MTPALREALLNHRKVKAAQSRLRAVTDARDAAIVRARAEGNKLSEIGEVLDLSKQNVQRILERFE